MANTIQIKRGAIGDIPALSVGELGFATDTFQLFVGNGGTNYEAVMHQLYGAQSILAATSDNTPVELTVGEQSVVGRITSGNVAALTGANLWTILTGQAGADLAMNTKKITGVVDPTGAQDAATKNYVDSVAQGLTVHTAVVAATTGNITLANEQTIDGISCTAADRVLVKDQTAPDENGIYACVNSGAWTRVADMDAASEVPSAFVYVTGGTTLGSTGWVCTNEPEDIVLETTNITFAQFSSAGYVTASTGLTKTGNDIAISDTELLALAGLTFADNKIIIGTGAGTVETIDCTAFAETILDDANQATVQATLGVVPGTDVLAEQTVGIANDNLLEVDGTPLNTEVAVFTAAGINGLSKAETMAHLSGGATADFAMGGNKITGVTDPTTDQDVATYKWVTDNFASGSAGADTALSNLASVAINAALIPGTAGALDIGSTTKPWGDMWFAGTSGTPATNRFKLTGASTSGVRTATFPDKSGYVLLTAAESVINGGSFT